MAKKTPETQETYTLRLPHYNKATWTYLFLLLLFLILQYTYLSELKQLPSPLYGGDQYFHYGHVLHIYHGGNPFESSHYLDAWEHYPWLTHFTIAFLSWILFSNPLTITLLWFPLLTTILAGLFSYKLGKKLFQNHWLPVLFSLYWLTTLIPNLGPSMIAQYVLLPILALSWLHWEKPRNRLYAGLVYGITGLQHATLFIGNTFYLGLRFLYDYFHSFIRVEKNRLQILKQNPWTRLQQEIRHYLPVVVVGIGIALLYWWAPLFIYHGKTLNPWQEYSGQGVASLTLGLVFSNLYHTVLQFNGWTGILTSLFAILGVYWSWKQKKWTAWALWLIGVLGLAHPYITQPLLGTSFGYYRFSMFLSLPRALFLFHGAEYTLHKLRNKTIPYVTLALLGLLVLAQGHATFKAFEKDVWTQAGKNPNPLVLANHELGDWAAQNTDPQKATLSSHGETAFAYHSVTGRKVVFLRRTHANPYTHENQRIADAAVMLYGKNPAKVRELFQQYKVGYLFEDAQSLQNRALCAELWQNFSRGDYLEQAYSCLQTNPEFAKYLEENGLEYQKTRVRLDISEGKAPQFDMLLIKPRDLENFDLKPLHYATVGDQAVGVLFEIQAK